MTRASDTAKLLGAGATILDGTTISTADNTTQLTLTSTDADALVGPALDLYRNSASPADNDFCGQISFQAENDAGEKTTFGLIKTRIVDASNGTEDFRFSLEGMVAGSSSQLLKMDNTNTVFNEDSADIDFRVESNGNTHMLFVDAGNEAVGIGTATLANKLEVDGGASPVRIRVSTTGTDANEAGIIFSNSGKTADNDGIEIAHGGGFTSFNDLGGNELIRIAQSSNHGLLLIGETDSTPFGAGAPGKIVALNDGHRYGAIFGCDNVANREAVILVNNNGQVGSIKTNGSATTFNTSSDYRIKENVNYSFDATTRLKQLKPARFNFIPDANTTVDGFLAHEVSSIVPEAISGEKDAVRVWRDGEELPDGVSVGDNKLDDAGNTIPDLQSIDQSKLVPLLVKTIQELEARITALES